MLRLMIRLCLVVTLYSSQASAGVAADYLQDKLNSMVETLLSVFPDGTPGKAEATRVTSFVFELAAIPVAGGEIVTENVGSRLQNLAARATQVYQAFENAAQNAPGEMQAVLDSVFVRTQGKITYEGTQMGVPGVLVVQTAIGAVEVESGSAEPVVIGLAMTDVQGNYTIVHPGNVLALLDGTPDLVTRVTLLFDVSSTPKGWQLSYDADGDLSRVRVE